MATKGEGEQTDVLTLRSGCGDRRWREKKEICRHYAAVVTTEEGETNRNELKLRLSFGDRTGRNKRNALTPRSVCGDPGNGKNIKSSGCGDQGGANKHKCVETTQRLWRPTGGEENINNTRRLRRPTGARKNKCGACKVGGDPRGGDGGGGINVHSACIWKRGGAERTPRRGA